MNSEKIPAVNVFIALVKSGGVSHIPKTNRDGSMAQQIAEPRSNMTPKR